MEYWIILNAETIIEFLIEAIEILAIGYLLWKKTYGRFFLRVAHKHL